MRLRVDNIQLDTSQVGGTFSESLNGFITLEKPRVVLQFIRQIVQDLVVPRTGHTCSVSCRELTTLVLGAPFQKDLETVAPE